MWWHELTEQMQEFYTKKGQLIGLCQYKKNYHHQSVQLEDKEPVSAKQTV